MPITLAGILQQQVAGGAFAPSDVSGLVLWLDADDASTLTDDGAGECSLWEDKSASGFDVSASGAQRPTITSSAVNSRTALSFNGSSNRIGRAADTQIVGASDGSFTMFAVALSDVTSGSRQIVCGDDGAGDRHPQFLRTSGSTAQSIVFSGSSAANDAGPTITTATAYILEAVSDGSSIECLVDGVGAGGSTARASQNTGAGPVDIGARPGAADLWDGYVCEVVAYNSAISTSDRASVRSYLSSRWGTA